MKWRVFILIIVGLAACVIVLIFVLKNPVFSVESVEGDILVRQSLLEEHVEYLSSLTPSRSFENIESLNKARDYIVETFESYGCEVELQTYWVEGREYSNVICSFGKQFEERIVIGAHYDVHHDNNPGADDNASGVAGILEIARLLSADESVLSHRVDVIAYTLEELPNFKRGTMGSMMHAQKAREENHDIKLMVVAEMIGYFSDEPGSQKFPLPGMTMLYPSTGDFVAVIGRLADGSSVRGVKKAMMGASDLPVYSLNAPSIIPEITFSDHASYWTHGFDAVMVTDTSFMRNPHYHKPTDAMETIDFSRMTKVVKGLYNVVVTYNR